MKFLRTLSIIIFIALSYSSAIAQKAKSKETIVIKTSTECNMCKERVEKGMAYSYIHRKQKKRNFRKLWILRINAAARLNGMSYSTFMGAFNKSGMVMNRKVLADLAMNHPEAFKAVVDQLKK